jgi:ubiquitin-like 1-activating enzyme E1 B
MPVCLPCLQVSVHLKGRTECFECQPKPLPKSFPVCTVRSTPDKPIHCIVWAKEVLFPLLFGAPEAPQPGEEPPAAAAGAAAGVAAGKGEEAEAWGPASFGCTGVEVEQRPALPNARAPAGGEGEEDGSGGDATATKADDPALYVRLEGESGRQYAERVFRQASWLTGSACRAGRLLLPLLPLLLLRSGGPASPRLPYPLPNECVLPGNVYCRLQYCTKIEELCSMEVLWRSRRPPQPMGLDALLAPAQQQATNGDADGAAAAAAATGGACKALGLADAHAVWDVQQNAALFLRAVELFLEQRQDELGSLQVSKELKRSGHISWLNRSVSGQLVLARCHFAFKWNLPLPHAPSPYQPPCPCPCPSLALLACPACPSCLQFDKDDALAVEFVTAASNLRAACYGIPMQSLFETKASQGSTGHMGV